MAQVHTDRNLLPTAEDRREAVLRVLAAASFLIFFQSFLVAPLIPALSVEFRTSPESLGLLIPAFMLPYGTSTLFYGPLSDRIGRKRVILTLLGLTVGMTAGTATAHTVTAMLIWRILGGAITGGVVPIALALLGDLFPYEERGKPMGWIFGAVAGGMAFGSTCGAFLNPYLGWRNEFLVTAALSGVVLVWALRLRDHFEGRLIPHPIGLGATLTGYLSLFANPRAARAYVYILLNGTFHSGVYSWLSLYFARRYGLGDRGIGMALLAYGVPGMLLGPTIGRAADRFGRRRFIPMGILLAALAAAAYIPRLPLAWPALLTGILSLGYDMSHPLLAGLITSVNPRRRGLAMGMNAFVLFVGFGLGPLAFALLLRRGFDTAFAVFATAQLCFGFIAVPLFRSETSSAEDQLLARLT